MSDSEIGKREIEREHLGIFLDAYEAATAETFSEMIDSETPDFIGRDAQGCTVGIEITQLRFAPDEQDARRIFPPNSTDDDAWFRLLDLMHRKHQTLTKGRWPQCERKILVIMLIDTSLDAIMTGAETEISSEGGFTEIWLVDHTQFEVFGAADLFAVAHPALKGRFATGDHGQNPYGRVRPNAAGHAHDLIVASIMRRIAADREATLFRTAHASTAAISSPGSRSATSGSLPVAGRPRPRFFGITFIDFRAIAGLYLKGAGPQDKTCR